MEVAGVHIESLPCIHQGEHSSLYLQDPSDYGVPVVWKLPHIGATSRDTVHLANEYSQTRGLSIPGVRRALDFVSVDGEHALVLEYVSGFSLRERLDDCPMGVDEALEAAAAVAGVLGALAREGIVHGNICSENILIEEKERPTTLVGFGLAFGRARTTHTVIRRGGCEI